MPYLCYDVRVLSNSLLPSSYSDYQTNLSDEIIRLRNKNLTFKNIAEQLNERGYVTPRNKRIEANHVFSIIKKRRIRDLRLSADQQ